MKQKKSLTRTFHDPIYGAEYKVCITEDEDIAERFLGFPVCTAAAWSEMVGLACKLWIGEACFSTITHEAYHCTRHLNRYINGELTDEIEEPMAYYIGWLSKKLWILTNKACQEGIIQPYVKA